MKAYRFIVDLSLIYDRRNFVSNDTACHFDMMGGLSYRDDYDCLLEMTRDFSPSVAFLKDSHFSCHKERKIWHMKGISKSKS